MSWEGGVGGCRGHCWGGRLLLRSNDAIKFKLQLAKVGKKTELRGLGGRSIGSLGGKKKARCGNGGEARPQKRSF